MSITFKSFPASGGGAGTDTLDDVTGRGSSTANSITVGGVSIGTEYTLPATDGSSNQFIKTDGAGALSFAALDITGGLEYKGSYDASTNSPLLTNAEKGDFYIVSAAGTRFGRDWSIGDHLLINEDMGGVVSNGKIDKIDNTDTPASETVAGVIAIATNVEAAAATATNKALVPSNISSLDLADMDNTTSGFIADLVEDTTPQLGGPLDVNGQIITSASNNNVAIDPDGTGDISIGADLIPDVDITHTIGDEDRRYISTYSDLNGALRFKAKVDHVGGILKGQVLYINGLAGDGTTPTVSLADADDANKMPAFGLAYAAANDNAEIQVVTFGNLEGLNTSTFSVGDTVFVDTTAGGLVSTAPTGETSLLQNIGRVVRSNNGAGIIKVGGAGRSAATPNLDQNKIFLGNASNQAVSTSLSSIALSSFNKDLDLNDLSDVSYTADPSINDYVLTYDHASTSWGAEAAPTAAAASETVAGIIEIATNVEAAAATATDKALVPSNISSLDLADMDNTTSGFISTVAAASETVAGIIEIATNVEADAATATNKALVPSNIASFDLSDMNNTTSGFIANINSESLNDLSDVAYTAGAGIDNYVLTYDHASTSWGAEAAASGGGGWTYSAITADPANAQASYHYSCTGTFTITLATSGMNAGEEIRIKNMGTGTITIDPGTQTIDGDPADYVLDVEFSAITLVSTGTNWEII